MFWTVTYKLLVGFRTTCALFAVTLIMSLPLGLLISFGSMSKRRPLRYIIKTFIWIIRGIPLLLQIFIVFYVPAFLYRAPLLGRTVAAVTAMTINYACYFSEIFRGGIESISHSQYEAGQVLGMTKAQIFFRVILLQVIKRITAPMSNEFINLVKDTSLARIIMVAEVFKAAEDFMNTYFIVWPLFYTAVFYLAAVGLLTLLFGHAEKRLGYFKA